MLQASTACLTMASPGPTKFDAEAPMKAEMMHTTTSDGFRMDGAFFGAATSAESGTVDAVLIIHGSGGRFYAPILLHFAQRLRDSGYPSLSLNTLGHETVWMGEGGEFPHGNAFEILDRSRFDIRSGIDWLESRGYHRIGLLGRSMGAVKVVYYGALEQDTRVATIIAASPVLLSYSHYMKPATVRQFSDIYQAFQKMADEGRPDELLHVPFPINHIFSATSYLDKHGPEERYNVLRLANRITVPLLSMSGSKEVHARLNNVGKDLAASAVNSPLAQWVEVEGAEHGHAGKFEESSLNLLDWLARLANEPVLATAPGA